MDPYHPHNAREWLAWCQALLIVGASLEYVSCKLTWEALCRKAKQNAA
jgi:hypothetical protein